MCNVCQSSIVPTVWCVAMQSLSTTRTTHAQNASRQTYCWSLQTASGELCCCVHYYLASPAALRLETQPLSPAMAVLLFAYTRCTCKTRSRSPDIRIVDTRALLYFFTFHFFTWLWMQSQWRRNHRCAGCWRTPINTLVPRSPLVEVRVVLRDATLVARANRPTAWSTPIIIKKSPSCVTESGDVIYQLQAVESFPLA